MTESVQLVNQQEQLTSICQTLKASDRIAIDLEFDKNYYRYGFNLCLMQLFDGETCYLIDPLSQSMKIETIFPILVDSSIEKVAFAFGEDLRLLHKIGCFPKNVYDLDNAISLLNYSPASLTNHLENILDIKTGQSKQMSNWYERPLSDQQIVYATEDVKYLFMLHDRLKKESEEKNVAKWINEENRAALQEDHSSNGNVSGVKHKHKKQFTEWEWHIYTRLMETREQLSETLDRPAFKVIKEDVLMEIAKDHQKLNRWSNTRGIHRRLKSEKMKQKMKAVLEEAIEEAEKLGLSDTDPADKPLSPEERNERRVLRERVNKAKSELFNPIKEKIEQDYGKEVSTFLFSNRIIGDIIADDDHTMLSYKEELLRDYANQLNIDISKYI